MFISEYRLLKTASISSICLNPNALHFKSLSPFARHRVISSQPGWPDWANFRLMGNSFIWAVFRKMTEVARKIGLLFSSEKVVYLFWQKHAFWAIFHKLIWSPCLHDPVLSATSLFEIRVERSKIRPMEEKLGQTWNRTLWRGQRYF
jgi:hypothetical protein